MIIKNDPLAYRWLRTAYENARDFSDDPSTHNGAVLVPDGNISNLPCFGANHFPQGVEVTPERLADRDTKLLFMEHAERDAIFTAAIRGISTLNATLYVPWFSCAPCARAIVSAGIARVVGHKQMMDKTPERWVASIKAGDVILDEACVQRIYYDGPIFNATENFQVLFNGEFWTP
jgi:dCMP deaminase